MPSDLVYLGVKAHVTAIDRTTGRTSWQTKLKVGLTPSGDSFVSLLVDEGLVYAHTRGQMFCLDAANGDVLWQNELDGLGYGIASLAVEGRASAGAPAIAHRKQQQAGAAAATTTGATVGASGH